MSCRGLWIFVAAGFLLAGCGEERENHLSLGVSTSSQKVYVYSGGAQPCFWSSDAGGLPDATGYYFRIDNVGLRWTSTDSAVRLNRLTASVMLPSGSPHTCTWEGDDLRILFGISSLSIGPAQETDECVEENGTAIRNCIQRNSLQDGRCAMVCGGMPMDPETPNFVVPATIELSGSAVKENESFRISRSVKILVENSK